MTKKLASSIREGGRYVPFLAALIRHVTKTCRHTHLIAVCNGKADMRSTYMQGKLRSRHFIQQLSCLVCASRCRCIAKESIHRCIALCMCSFAQVGGELGKRRNKLPVVATHTRCRRNMQTCDCAIALPYQCFLIHALAYAMAKLR